MGVRAHRENYGLLLSKSIAEPLDTRRIAFDQERIEAASGRRAQAGEVMTRGAQQASTLGCGNARGGAAKSASCAAPNFHENRRGPVARDEIDLTESAAIVALDDSQAAAFQESRGQRLGFATAAIQRFSPSTVSLPALMIATSKPRWICRSGPRTRWPVTPSRSMSRLPARSSCATRKASMPRA